MHGSQMILYLWFWQVVSDTVLVLFFTHTNTGSPVASAASTAKMNKKISSLSSLIFTLSPTCMYIRLHMHTPTHNKETQLHSSHSIITHIPVGDMAKLPSGPLRLSVKDSPATLLVQFEFGQNIILSTSGVKLWWVLAQLFHLLFLTFSPYHPFSLFFSLSLYVSILSLITYFKLPANSER